MKLLTTIMLAFLLTACVTTQVQDNGYLPMPEEFLGYWRPRGRASGIAVLNVLPNGTIEYLIGSKKDETTNTYYKVFHIEDGYVYMIVKEVDHDPETTLINPRWKYIRYSIAPPIVEGDIKLLRISREHCDLSEKDWHLPAHIHWERLQNKTCLKTKSDSLFESLTSYAR